ncbi:MAG TPA: YfiR family protein [Opitutaceae bacterium]|nr:YfiR family protein [Opitutaceae bacterium]
MKFAIRTLWIWALLLPLEIFSQGRTGLSEQELKAAALNQMVHFARWPSDAFADPTSPLIIGIYGEDPFGSLMDDLVEGEAASGHPIKVVRCFTPEAAAACHAVYVRGSDRRAADRLVHVLSGKSVLTVCDDESITAAGAIVGLTVRNNRIHILVNLDAARRAKVTLSSKLLRLAEIVKE